jgi:MerR-like DNA binding protein
VAEYITRSEAARRAVVHVNTIRDWERRGLVRTKRIATPSGEQVHIAVPDLERVITERPSRRKTELEECRERLATVEAERDRLLAEVLEIARGRREGQRLS